MSSSGSAYAFKPGGLKFKGSDDSKSKKKKKKERSSTSVAHREKEAITASGSSSSALATRVEDEDDEAREQEREDEEIRDEVDRAPGASNMTEAERKFQEVRMKRMRDRVKKEAKRSHKDKVDSFNKYLEAQTDHFDLPRIGPG